MGHLPKSEICDKTWSTESLKELLFDMNAKDQIELVDSGYKIKQDEAQDGNDFDNNCNFVKNTQIDCTSSVSDNLVANLETVIIPETQQTPLLPSDLSVTPRRPIKSVYNDNTQSFISLQNMFLKEIETMKNFTKSVEKKFEEIENFITSLSVNNHSVGTPEKESEREYPLIVELLKSRVSTLEKQLAEKDAIIDFLLNQKVQNEIDNTTFISKVSNSDIQREKNPTNSNIKNLNSEEKQEKVKTVVTGDSILNSMNEKGLSKSHSVNVKSYPGATSEDILDKINNLLKVKPDCLLVHVGTNDLTNKVDLLISVKKMVKKVKNSSPNTKLVFSSVILHIHKKYVSKKVGETNQRLKNYCKQKILILLITVIL